MVSVQTAALLQLYIRRRTPNVASGSMVGLCLLQNSFETRILKFHNHLRCLITTSNVRQEHRTNTKTEGTLIANRSLTWPRKPRRLWQSTARRLSYLGSGWSQSRPLHHSSSISEEESRDQLLNVLTLNDGHLRKYARFRISISYNSVLKIHACKVGLGYFFLLFNSVLQREEQKKNVKINLNTQVSSIRKRSLISG